MSKKSGYKYRIEQELLKKDWEIITIGSNTIWWDDEHWKVSLKYNSDVTFYLCFIVDPMFEGQRKSGQGIYEIKASSKFPTNWNDETNEIASICMSKRNFENKLNEFIIGLEQYKKLLPTINKNNNG